MNYSEIVSLIFTILTTLFGLIYAPFAIFFIVGLFKRKTFPKTDEKCKYGIVVAARNEENVIAQLIKSIRKNKYPQDKLDIFIVAHNCTDNTAQIARDHGAIVFEYNNPEEATKGFAFKHAFERIKAEYGLDKYDGFFSIDSDNVFPKDYFDKMNDAFVANNKNAVITSCRNSKNFDYNLMSGCYGVYFLDGCRFEMRGRTVLGVATRVSGTGFLFASSFMEQGWNYVTLTEDWEFTADQILDGHDVVYCDEAEFFDEQPVNFPIMWRQRVRWSRGHLLVFFTRIKRLLKAVFGGKKNRKGRLWSHYDFTANILPFGQTLFFLNFLQYILLMFSPLFGENLGTVLWSSLSGTLISLGVGYVLIFLWTLLLYIVERKRIHLGFWKALGIALVYPLFIAIQVPIDVVALFAKNLAWKVIPHHDQTEIDHIDEKRALKEAKKK